MSFDRVCEELRGEQCGGVLLIIVEVAVVGVVVVGGLESCSERGKWVEDTGFDDRVCS